MAFSLVYILQYVYSMDDIICNSVYERSYMCNYVISNAIEQKGTWKTPKRAFQAICSNQFTTQLSNEFLSLMS